MPRDDDVAIKFTTPAKPHACKPIISRIIFAANLVCKSMSTNLLRPKYYYSHNAHIQRIAYPLGATSSLHLNAFPEDLNILPVISNNVLNIIFRTKTETQIGVDISHLDIVTVIMHAGSI